VSSDLELVLLLERDLLRDDEYDLVRVLDLEESGEFDFKFRTPFVLFLLTGETLLATGDAFPLSFT